MIITLHTTVVSYLRVATIIRHTPVSSVRFTVHTHNSLPIT